VELYEAGRIDAAGLQRLIEDLLHSTPDVQADVLRYVQSLAAQGRVPQAVVAATVARTAVLHADDPTSFHPAFTARSQAETVLNDGVSADSETAMRPAVQPTREMLRQHDADPYALHELSQPGGFAPLEPGMRLRDRYVLEEIIGKGAMGQVWKARDLFAEEARGRNPFVAIKVLLSDFERHPQAFAAMHREATRARDLAHPNIGTVYTLDRDERSGRPFIAMELLGGESLEQTIRRNGEQRPPPKLIWPIVKGMAEGLAYAHRKGIVHSDFKPGNVFLCADGVPKILDFGIARAARPLGQEQDDDSVFAGYTQSYASPALLANEPSHTSDDVFALGIVVYELLTGVHPFGRRSAREARDAGMTPPPVPGIPRHEWRVIRKALAFERDERWQDASAFLKALQRHTKLQLALVAAVVALVVTAGGLSYRNYLDKLPAVPFERLSQAQQEQVRQALMEGNRALQYVRDNKLIEASADAADRFADAYAIHPRNPEAVAGLDHAADYFIDWWAAQPDQNHALEELKKFRDKSEYYQGYAPLTRAIARLEAK
jgi:hypothetical protein